MSTDTAANQVEAQPEMDWTPRRLLAIFWGVLFPWIMTFLWVVVAALAGFSNDVRVIGIIATVVLSGVVGVYRWGWYLGLWKISR